MSNPRAFFSDLPSVPEVNVVTITTGLDLLLVEALSGNEKARQALESLCRELIKAVNLVHQMRGAAEDS
jgi:hypothetical protein